MTEANRLQGAPLVIVELDAGLVVTAWNDQAAQVFAVASAAAVGRSVVELLPSSDGADGWRARLAATGGPHLWSIARADAAAIELEAWTQVTPGDDGQPQRFTIYGHDVTAREQKAHRQRLESSLLAAMKQNLDLVVWAIDRNGTFIYQSGKGLAAASLVEDQFVGMNMFELYTSGGGSSAIEQAIKSGQPHYSPPELQHGVYWESWYVPADPKIGSDAWVIGVTLNVSEAKRREAELLSQIELIEKQQEVIRGLSTPIIEVWDGVLTLPIVGLVDSVRTAEIMDNLLQSVTRTRARFAVLDLTGVEVVDTGTASHLIGLIRAIRLLGAEGVLTGISPDIAQTIVALGVDLSHIAVFAKLRDALKYSIARMSAVRKAKG